jgi:O-antigen ligase
MISAMGALAVLFNNPGSTVAGEGKDAAPAFIICWLTMYALTILFMPLVKWRLGKGDFILLSIGIWFALTSMWSNIPDNSIKYSFSLSMNIFAAMFISRVIPREDFPRFFTITAVVVSALSIIMMMTGFENVFWVDPHSRLTILNTEPIRGLFFHKIPAGIYAAIAFWLSILVMKGISRYFCAVVCLLFDALTGSSIGLALLPVTGILILLIKLSRSGRISTGAFFIILGILMCSGIAFFYVFGGDVLALLDRDPTLTGRTLLWSWGIDTALERPFLGWGFFGYFGSPEASAAAQSIAAFANYDVPHFHNSYIQMLVEIGIVPAISILVIFFGNLGKWHKYYAVLHVPEGIAYYAILSSLLFVGCFSLVFVRYNDISTLLIFLCICYAYQPVSVSRPQVPSSGRRF